MQKFNIYYRKDGRWEGRISKGKGEDGRRKFQYIFGKTKQQVQNKMKELTETSSSCYCKINLQSIADEWISTVTKRVKESTSSNYIMKLQKHILPEFGNKSISNLSADSVYSFIEKKRREGLSDRYISDILVLLKSIFKYSVRKYHINDIMVNVSMPKKGKPDIQLLDDCEQKKLQSVISARKDHTSIGVALSLTTGIRIGELCALQWKDIDLEKRILTVRKTIQRIQVKESGRKTKLIITSPKSETLKRSIPITRNMVDLLLKIKGDSEDYVLSGNTKPVEPRAMQYRFAKMLKNAKLPSVHFHSLRHSFASNCIKSGFDVKALSELLGHSSVEITLNRYVHSSFEQKREYMERLQFDF